MTLKELFYDIAGAIREMDGSAEPIPAKDFASRIRALPVSSVFPTPVPTYTITASIDPAGSGTDEGAGNYPEGTQVTIKSIPKVQGKE